MPGIETAGGPPDAKLTLFVGSDTQIAEIGGMLDAHWTLDSHLNDETPPSGGLAFERLVDKATGQRPDGACPIETVAKIVSAAVDPTAAAPQTYH